MGDSTQVIVYPSPIPDCKGADAFQRYSYEGIAVNTPKLISPSLVVNDSVYRHFLSVEVDQAAHDLLGAISASGAHNGETDASCAQAGLDKVADQRNATSSFNLLYL